MAGAFAKLATTLIMVDCGLIALFVFGPGLTVLPVTSLSPPSRCIAQRPTYQAIGTLMPCTAMMILTSILLSAFVYIEVAAAGGSLEQMAQAARILLRVCMALAVVTSAASVGLGLATWAFVFEAKVTVFACVPVGVLVCLGGCYAVAIAASGFVWYRLARAAVLYN